MSALHVPDLPSATWSAGTPKDLSRWHGKRDVLRKLYISQGKSLNDVKAIMEREHGFPNTLRHSDYEHVLREEFNYRKHLTSDEWRLSVRPQIARRKAEGKRSEVLLNGSKVQNVDRKIERSLHSKRSRRLNPAELPYGVTIRTPSPQPPTVVASLPHLKSLEAKGIDESKRYELSLEPSADFPAELDWLDSLAGNIALSDAGSRAAILLSAQLLREGCPINKLLSTLDENRRKFNQADLRLFGPNASIGILGKMCFDFSNNLQDQIIPLHEMRSILDWIGFSVDIAILKTFFSQRALTILAVWEALSRTILEWKHLAAFDILLSVHLSIRDQTSCIIGKPYGNLSHCLQTAPNRVATLINAYPCNQRELDQALRTAAFREGPIDLVEQLIGAGASLKDKKCPTSVDDLIRYFTRRECEALDLALLKLLLEAGAVVDEPLPTARSKDWSEPNHPIHVTDSMLLNWGRRPYYSDALWSLVSLYSDRQQTTVTVPGIFQAAEGGQEQLRSYLNARLKPYDDRDRTKVLEIALSEASEAGHTSVVQNLVQFGVNPNVPSLPRSIPVARAKNIWHPVIRALNSGQLNTLRILVTESIVDLDFLEDDVGQQLDLCSLRNMENPHRSQLLRVFSFLGLSTTSRSGILLHAIKPHRCRLRSHDGADYELVDQLLELGLAYLDCPEHLEEETSHILVRAIQTGCDVRALEYLVQRDAKVLSTLSAGMIGALLKVSIKVECFNERHEILGFLAQRIGGLWSYVRENGSSLLSCLLKHAKCGKPSWHPQRVNHWEDGCEAMATLKWFLDVGATLSGPILANLLPHANDSFMLAIIHSARSTNAKDDCDALQLSIGLGRLNLAVALIERGVDINDTHPRIRRRSPLQRACEKAAPLWFIRFLIEQGADVNALPASDGGRMALQAACARGAELSHITFLIEKGADVNGPPAEEDGLTALQYAAFGGLMNVAGLLLDHGADVNALSGVVLWDTCLSFMRAIDFAAEYSRLDMVHLLIAAGARSCQPGLTGFEGAINIATRRGHFAVARLLQEHAESGSQDRMEAERTWLRQNPDTCMYKGRIQVASWVDFMKSVIEESESDVVCGGGGDQVESRK